MRRSTKHQNQQTKAYETFEGGLNTVTSEEFIAETQLSECINMECDAVTRRLFTSKGTRRLLSLTNAEDIKFAAWDNINEMVLVFTKNGEIYATDTEYKQFTKVGELSGEEDVVTCAWEDGVLIASGGKLQYGKFVDNTYTVSTLAKSPDVCRCVFVRSGRVVIFGYTQGDDTEDYVHYSSVGDEETWDVDVNDPSMGQFTQIGYKVGGKLLAACNLATDILLVKDNGMCFRLENEYPNWVIKEVGRHIYCNNVNCICPTGGSGVMMLGAHQLQTITPTQDYGDVRPQLVGLQVKDQLAYLPACTKMRYLPELNQVWFVSEEQYVLVFDCNLLSFYQRYFNSDVVDVLNLVNDVIIVKKDGLCILDNNTSKCEDDGKPLQIRARFKAEASINDFLIKAAYLSVTPLKDFYDKPNVTVTIGRINLSIPQRIASTDGFLKQTVGETQKAIEPASPTIDDVTNPDVAFTPDNLQVGKSILLKTRKLFRGERIRLSLSGEGFPFILNYIAYDRVEV